ncbi:PKD domain-containing protein [Mucilaginibacter sp. FT3.2]|uniref:PKD domain-containing protein n=1 Tax=Mucilaginibacter sp. FT3.2 TaxID=2723090 RepID=UPI00160CA078|nr:PKD domain-containing protein [Mucilaginibacter sp. FT3.2]MBB6230044.1 gliding motility-associated-like protein [Mucilaginibacter sp. FT3.2]
MLVALKVKKTFTLITGLLFIMLFGRQAHAQSLGDPVVKITFGSGTASRGGALSADSGTTTYIYSGSGEVGENYYTITNQVNTSVHGSFVTSYDHDYETTGNTNGYMMVVNGNLQAGTVYTRTVPGLCANTQYQFGVWIKNVLSSNGIPPNMVFHIYAADGTTELSTPVSTGDVPTGKVWHNYTANFTLPAGTGDVIIKLVSNASGQVGNDFAVDDITFSPYGSTVSAVFAQSTSATESTCAGSTQTYTINATSTLASGYVQKLQMYVNGVWQDLSTGGTTGTFTISSPTVAGTYKYRLVSATTDNISSASCVVASNNLTLTVTPAPTAAFTAPDATCLGTATVFTDASVANGTTINSWLWNFGDGQTSALKSPSHTYATAGSYTVTLTVAGNTGCTPSVATKIITISPLPVAAFTFSTPDCLTQAATITDQSTTGTGTTITSWVWDYGDGTTETKTSNAIFQHLYAAAGTYALKLTVTNSGGCTATSTKSITVSPLPVVAFITPDVCLADASATFTDNSTIPDNTTSGFTYLWNFGDANATATNSNTSTLKNPSHKYTQAAVYQVTLTVTSASGCVSTLTKSFTVNGSIPVASFTVAGTTLCSDKQVTFTNTSTVDFGNITKLEWYYDYANNPSTVVTDDNPTYGKTYNYTYTTFHTPATQNYQIRLVAYSGGTCVSIMDKTITLLAVPELTFTAPSAVCVNGGTVQLAAQEVAGVAGSGIYTGTGVSSTGLFNPATAGVGTYNISYIYTATNACPETVSQSITVSPIPVITVGPDITVLSGGSAKMPATASGSALTYLWSPATYLDDVTKLNPTITPLQDVTYTLTVTNSEGCLVSGQVKVSVLQGPVVPNVFSPNGDGTNDQWNIKYLNTYTDCTVEVFNRYGARLFASVGYNVPWDGTYNGTAVPSGVYYYIINPKHGRSTLSGSLTILR